jgi:hypothetical protein
VAIASHSHSLLDGPEDEVFLRTASREEIDARFLERFDKISQLKSKVELPDNPRILINLDNVNNFRDGVIPPYPPGGYLEPSTHFFVNEISLDTLQVLINVMKENHVDMEVVVGCFLHKCEAYRDCARCEFNIRVFSIHDERGEYAIEFQRRFGDGMVFYNLYNKCKKEMEEYMRKKAGGASPTVRPRALSPLQCPPLDIPELRCCRQVTKDVLINLTEMCKSDCVDVKANAITALAEMSSKPEMKEPMIQGGLVDIFLDQLGCTYQDVHRCALTGLANLIGCKRNTGTCQAWMQNEKVKHTLCRLVHSGCPQIVRECARSFELLAETLKDQLKDDECFRHCVEQLSCSHDSATRECALRAKEQLDMVS